MPRSSAERRSLDWLGGLDDTWAVLHSVGLARHDRKRWAEADLVVVGPAGVLVIEVKGGRIHRRAGNWGFQDRHGHTDWRPEGPYEQVGGAEAVIRRHLRSAGALGHGVACGWAVIAPDTHLFGLGPDAWDEVTIDAADGWPDVTTTVERLLGTWASRTGAYQPLDGQSVARVVAALRGDVHGSLTTREKVRAAHETTEILRRGHMAPLHAARLNRRLVVLTPRMAEAVDAVRQVVDDLPDHLEPVLVLVPNRAVAERLTDEVDCDVAWPQGAGLVVESAGRGVRLSVDPRAGDPWGAMIVVRPETSAETVLADLVENRLVGGAVHGVLRVFADPGLHSPSAAWAVGAAVIELPAGYRAGNEVLEATARLTDGPAVRSPVEGLPLSVEWFDGSDAALADTVDRCLAEHDPDEVCVVDAGPRYRHAQTPVAALDELSQDVGDGGPYRGWPEDLIGLDFDCLVVINVDLVTATGRSRLYTALNAARLDLRLVLLSSDRDTFVAAIVSDPGDARLSGWSVDRSV